MTIYLNRGHCHSYHSFGVANGGMGSVFDPFLAPIGRGQQRRVLARLTHKILDSSTKEDEFSALKRKNWSPLHQAAFNGIKGDLSEVAETLEGILRESKNSNTTDKINAVVSDKAYTPLHLASMKGFQDIVSFLLENDADPRMKTLDGKTAVKLAKKNGHKEVAHQINDFMKTQKKNQRKSLKRHSSQYKSLS